MKNTSLATTEAREAHDELKGLVRETHHEIASLARQGASQLNDLSPDKYSPMDLPTGMYDRGGFFRARRILRSVTPKIFAELGLDGFPGLNVVGASTEHTEYRHYFGSFVTSLFATKPAPHMTFPGSRSAEKLSLHIVTDETLEKGLKDPAHAAPYGDFRPAIYANGRAEHSVDPLFDACKPSAPMRWMDEPHRFKYATGAEVRDSYSQAYPEALAISGLIAHGLRTFDIDIDTQPAAALFNDWQELKGEDAVRTTSAEPIWTKSNAPLLRQHAQ